MNLTKIFVLPLDIGQINKLSTEHQRVLSLNEKITHSGDIVIMKIAKITPVSVICDFCYLTRILGVEKDKKKYNYLFKQCIPLVDTPISLNKAKFQEIDVPDTLIVELHKKQPLLASIYLKRRKAFWREVLLWIGIILGIFVLIILLALILT